MFLGIDLGTSSVKAVLIDETGTVVDESTSALSVLRPQPMWSEQDPDAWWRATLAAVAGLRDHALSGVRGVGLSGQMHGAVLLDAQDRVIRPAILWNDGRSASACQELERREPASRDITGNLAMPGFTAPKLIWMATNEPENFRRTAHVLLPKDWLRLRLTGEFVSEPSDAAGTLWLDVARRRWSPAMLAACALDERHMPRLVEGTEISGQLTRGAATALGLRPGTPVAGGGSDNACGAVGIGVVRPGEAFVSLGTSGVIAPAARNWLADQAIAARHPRSRSGRLAGGRHRDAGRGAERLGARVVGCVGRAAVLRAAVPAEPSKTLRDQDALQPNAAPRYPGATPRKNKKGLPSASPCFVGCGGRI